MSFYILHIHVYYHSKLLESCYRPENMRTWRCCQRRQWCPCSSAWWPSRPQLCPRFSRSGWWVSLTKPAVNLKHKQSLLNRKMCYQLSKNPQTTLDIYQMHRNYIMTYRYYCFVLLKYSCKLWLKLSNASKTTSSCFIKIPSYLVSWLFLHYRWQCSQQRRFPPPFWSPLVWKIC